MTNMHEYRARRRPADAVAMVPTAVVMVKMVVVLAAVQSRDNHR